MKPRHLNCLAHFGDPPDGSIDVREHLTGPQHYPDNRLVSRTRAEVPRNQEEEVYYCTVSSSPVLGNLIFSRHWRWQRHLQELGWWPTIDTPDQVLALEPTCIWQISKKKRKRAVSHSNIRSSFAIRIPRNVLMSYSSSLCRIRLKILLSVEILTTRLKGEAVLMVTLYSLQKCQEKTSVLSTTGVVLRMFVMEKVLLSNHTFTKTVTFRKKSQS
ncbi:hypothetical protein AVEN_268485-1 [Araneus ventricosus]|uniref:Uncharacterized protein n=1 Tax=Araneus ventricosus TaxID=182803 RepID=A0A4Y2L5X0_ARAVE|nr:hypothetical protein AVEN_268485-1 [Araneus ventricosus]